MPNIACADALMAIFGYKRERRAMDVPRMLEDKREIKSLAQDIWFVQVGEEGVTKIIAYGEPALYNNVPWFAIYKGNFLAQRVDAAGMVVAYKEET